MHSLACVDAIRIRCFMIIGLQFLGLVSPISVMNLGSNCGVCLLRNLAPSTSFLGIAFITDRMCLHRKFSSFLTLRAKSPQVQVVPSSLSATLYKIFPTLLSTKNCPSSDCKTLKNSARSFRFAISFAVIFLSFLLFFEYDFNSICDFDCQFYD